MSMRASQYAIYKGMGSAKWGAMQLSFLPPHHRCESCKKKTFQDTNNPVPECNCHSPNLQPREGTVFVEACSAKGNNVYDWDNKISMALSIDDMGKLIAGFRKSEEVKILHDPFAGTSKSGQVYKTIWFSTPGGVMEKGGIFKFNQKENNEERTHTIPVTTSEVMVLLTLLNQAIIGALGWD